MAEGPLDGLVNGPVVEGDWQVGRVVDLPDLVVVAQHLVAQDLVGHVDPGFRATGQPVQHDNDVALGVEGLQQVQVGRFQHFAAADQSQQGLAGKTGARQPQAVA
ncbi:hypothetical protein D3C78_709930 [compost metagenome]